MAWFITVQNPETGFYCRHKARQLHHALSAVRRRFGRSVIEWSQHDDRFILENYKRIPATEIATMLTARKRRKITKNAVIGRYRTISKIAKGGAHVDICKSQNASIG